MNNVELLKHVSMGVDERQAALILDRAGLAVRFNGAWFERKDGHFVDASGGSADAPVGSVTGFKIAPQGFKGSDSEIASLLEVDAKQLEGREGRIKEGGRAVVRNTVLRPGKGEGDTVVPLAGVTQANMARPKSPASGSGAPASGSGAPAASSPAPAAVSGAPAAVPKPPASVPGSRI